MPSIAHLTMSMHLCQAFFWTFPQKLKVKKTKTQAKKTQNSRIFRPKLKIPANFSEIKEDILTKCNDFCPK